jgi:hypothetical protein
MPSLWITALQQYNGTKGPWCIPRKGTKEYDEVKSIMEGKKPKAEVKEKETPKKKFVFKKADKERPIIDAVNELKALRETISKEPKAYYTGQMTPQQKIRLGKAIEKVKGTHFNSGVSDKRWYELTADA